MSTPISETMTAAATPAFAGAGAADAGDRGQSEGRLAKGFEPIADLRVDLGNRRIDGIGLGEVDPQQQALVVGHATAQGFDDVCAGGVDPGMDLVGEAVGLTLRQGIEDRASAGAHDVRQDRAEFDVCRLQGLVDPLNMRDLFPHQLLAGARQVAQRLHRHRRHKARSDEAVRQQSLPR